MVPVEGGEPQTSTEETDVFVFDEIGGSFGVDAKTFAEDLNAITTPKIHLRINSPGGSVTEGMAIRSSLLHHPSWIRASVDGIAASAASVIALGADEIETMPGAQWMLHDASAMVEGNQAEFDKAATWIGRQSDNLADIYAKRMGISTEEARQLMLAETWAFADEAVEMGLADRVGGPNPAKQIPQDMQERMARKHDLTKWGYRFLGRDDAPAPRVTRTGAGRAVETRDQTVPAERSTPVEPMGRSIAYIEARQATDFDA
jgi:ATP-dependent protease ClpP protease subunit